MLCSYCIQKFVEKWFLCILKISATLNKIAVANASRQQQIQKTITYSVNMFSSVSGKPTCTVVKIMMRKLCWIFHDDIQSELISNSAYCQTNQWECSLQIMEKQKDTETRSLLPIEIHRRSFSTWRQWKYETSACSLAAVHHVSHV